MARDRGDLGDDQPRCPDPARFEVEGNAGVVDGVVGDPVIADEGIGVDEYLAEEGWVGEGLGVARHAGRENDLALDSRGRAEGQAFELGTVLEQEARPLSPGHWKLLGLRCPVWPAEARRRRTPRARPSGVRPGRACD